MIASGPITRKNRQTGTQVSVYSADDLGEPDMPWWTVCEDHGKLVGHYTKADALYHAAAPKGWCGVCNGTELSDEEAEEMYQRGEGPFAPSGAGVKHS